MSDIATDFSGGVPSIHGWGVAFFCACDHIRADRESVCVSELGGTVINTAKRTREATSQGETMTDEQFAEQIAASMDSGFLNTYGKILVKQVALLAARKIPWSWKQIMLSVADGIDGTERQQWIDTLVEEIDKLIKLPIYLEPFDDDFIRPVVERVFTYLEEGVSL